MGDGFATLAMTNSEQIAPYTTLAMTHQMGDYFATPAMTNSEQIASLRTLRSQ